jgi:hypothetical protein
MNIPSELKPYYEFTFIKCLPICSFCGTEQDFSSGADKCSDTWYLDMAAAIYDANWIIPEAQMSACPACAVEHKLSHDPKAYSE